MSLSPKHPNWSGIMEIANQNPLILLYNPKVTHPGHQRLPTSLLQLGAKLEGRFPYAIVDGNLDQQRDRAGEIIARVKRQGVRYLGVTMMPGPQLQQAFPDIQRIKAACPHLKIIVGGFFPSLHSQICVQDRVIDYVVRGAGEDSLAELLEALEAGRDPIDVAGLVFVGPQGHVVQTPQRPPTHPNLLPRLPYHRVPVERYITKTFLGKRTLSHHSSFGCPFHCNFCAVAGMAQGQWLAEDAARLGEVVQYLVDQWQMDGLEFHDNNFFVSEARVAAFCEELLRRGLKLNWWGQGRIDTLLDFNRQTWKLLQDSGLKMIFLGAESGDARTLRQMNKGGTLAPGKTEEIAALVRQYQIIPEFCFMVGNPADSDIVQSLEFIRQIKGINPEAEIVLSRFEPVPVAGEMWQGAQAHGFEFPQTLEEWAHPFWAQVQRRRGMVRPWFSKQNLQLIRDFETVLNAYYPTTTDLRLQRGPWRWILQTLGGWRYRRRFYRWPLELRALQSFIRYRRPETSGF